VWATYLGGENADVAQSIAVDSSGDVWTSGTTASVAFPNANGCSGGDDFLVEMNPTGAALVYSARYPNQTVAQAVGLDQTTSLVHAAGPTGIVSGIAPAQTPTIRVFGLVSMAGGETSGRAAAGEMVSIYGPHIGPAVPVAGAANSAGALPTTLGGVQVLLPGAEASLLYVSDSQIDVILPYSSTPVTVQIVNGGNTSPTFPVETPQALPQVFRNADGSAEALNQDGSVNSSSNRAKAGSLVTIWATATSYLPVTPGQITTTASNSCASQCQMNVYGSVVPGPFAEQATVVYAGASPGFASGFTEIVFQVPASIPSSYFNLYFNLSVNGVASGIALIYVTNQ
jgi:uncharacterized protein (TIGR03437 family)